jgi:hypothetical protein
MAWSAKRCLCLRRIPSTSQPAAANLQIIKIAVTEPFPSPVQLWRPQNRILFQVNTTCFRVALFGHQGYNEPRRDAQCRTHHCHKLTACCLETQRHNGTASYCNSHPGNAGNVRPKKANFVDSIPLHKLHHPSSFAFGNLNPVDSTFIVANRGVEPT